MTNVNMFISFHFKILKSYRGWNAAYYMVKANTYVLPLFQSCNSCLLGCKVISSLFRIKIRVHVIDNSYNEIRGGRVERDTGGDEKQLIKFAWPN